MLGRTSEAEFSKSAQLFDVLFADNWNLWYIYKMRFKHTFQNKDYFQRSNYTTVSE